MISRTMKKRQKAINPTRILESIFSLLIIIGVDLDTMKQIESHLLMRHYDGFMKKGKMRGRWS